MKFSGSSMFYFIYLDIVFPRGYWIFVKSACTCIILAVTGNIVYIIIVTFFTTGLVHMSLMLRETGR